MAQESPSWQQLLDLISTLDSGDYESVAVEFGDISVQLSRSGPIAAPVVAAPTPAAVPATGSPATAPAPAAAVPAADAAPAAPAPAPAAPAGASITAPMLGVFYRRPAPGEPPFVEVGAAVEPDTTIGIIEIMKLMNPVTAGEAGVIAAFEVEDGAQVQFGQVLARFEA